MSAHTPPAGPTREVRDSLRTRYGAASRFQSRLRQRTAPVPPQREVSAPHGEHLEAAPPA